MINKQEQKLKKETSKFVAALVIMVIAASSVGVALGYQGVEQKVGVHVPAQSVNQELSQGWVN